ncbi:hypothetical protein [Zobellella taiwanensis]
MWNTALLFACALLVAALPARAAERLVVATEGTYPPFSSQNFRSHPARPEQFDDAKAPKDSADNRNTEVLISIFIIHLFLVRQAQPTNKKTQCRHPDIAFYAVSLTEDGTRFRIFSQRRR